MSETIDIPSMNDRLIPMYEALVRGASFQTLIDSSRELFGNPVYVANCNLETVGHSVEKEEIGITWDRLVSDELEKHFEQEQITYDSGINEQMQNRSVPSILESPSLERRILTANIIWKGKLIGYAMVFEFDRKLTVEDVQMMQSVSRIFGYLIMSSHDLKNAMNPRAELTIQQLLQGKKLSDEILERTLFHREPDVLYYMIVIEGSDHAPYLLNLLTYEFRSLRASIVDERIAAVIQIPDTAQSGVQREKFAERFQRFLLERNLHAGISKAFVSLHAVKQYYEQALAAVQLGRDYLHTGHASSDRLFCYEDAAVYHLFRLAGEKENLRNFVDESVECLLRYDARYHTNWFETLTAYLACDCDSRKTSELLATHKNTIHYRVGKIEEIVGCDFKNPKLVLRLKLSVNILFFLDPDNFYTTYGVSSAIHMPFL